MGIARLTITILLVFITISTPILAHGLYWAAGSEGDTLMVGHTAGDGHGGDGNHPCSWDRIRLVQTLGPALGPDEVWEPVAPEGGALVWDSRTGSAIRLVLDWGWWVKTGQGSRPAHPDSVSGELQAWRTVETVWRLRPGQFPAMTPWKHGLEILPLGDLSRVHPGDRVTFLVLLRGEPVADVPVAYRGSTRGLTDSKGRIRLELRQAGWQTLNASYRRTSVLGSHCDEFFNARLDFNLEED